MSTDWSWTPDAGRWRLDEYGLPQRPTRVDVTTAAAPRRDAYEYWRGIAFTDFAAASKTPDEEMSFQAKASGLISQSGDFYAVSSASVSGSRHRRHVSNDGLDGISVGLVVDGERRARQEDDTDVVTGPGGLFVYDAAQTSAVDWGRHRFVYLVIRRPAVQSVLGRDLPAPSSLTAALTSSSLRFALRDQLSMIARQQGVTTSTGQAFLMEQASQLAVFALAQRDPFDQVPGPMLLHAAMRHVELHFADPELNTDRIARAMGCSRATLYRAFAAQGLGVAEFVRDFRLDHGRTLLESGPGHLSISAVATACGVYDVATFSRQFRRRFGFSPSEARR